MDPTEDGNSQEGGRLDFKQESGKAMQKTFGPNHAKEVSPLDAAGHGMLRQAWNIDAALRGSG
ncbi:hypothetical protein [Desulfuromonas sp.]|uniref:hypothetical protein n=1 Tax=Desulfuromonas sp. TaxID=892 RepID=UPI0025BED929|nr:hypothetical protein [Desulfuromonas sp.]